MEPPPAGTHMAIRSSNLILDHVEAEVLAKFEGRIEPAPLAKGAVLQEVGEEVGWVWFPERGLIGLQSQTPDGDSVAGGMVGWDGAHGAFEACGSRKSFNRAVVEVPGAARRMRAFAYRELFEASSALRAAVHKHVEALMAESRQFVLCNAIHPVENRLARALLDIYDRSNTGAALPLTQETLANMLGVQRTTIVVAVANLQRTGFLRATRGVIELINPAGLEGAACACRQAIADAHEEIYASAAPVCGA